MIWMTAGDRSNICKSETLRHYTSVMFPSILQDKT